MKMLTEAEHTALVARPGLPMCDDHLAMFSPPVRAKLLARGRS